MSKKILISLLADKIEHLANLNCPGCQSVYAPFKNHKCYTDTWCMKVFNYFDQAIEFMPEAKIYSRDYLYDALLNGPADD
jgi:hypothetical protein